MSVRCLVYKRVHVFLGQRSANDTVVDVPCNSGRIINPTNAVVRARSEKIKIKIYSRITLECFKNNFIARTFFFIFVAFVIFV